MKRSDRKGAMISYTLLAVAITYSFVVISVPPQPWHPVPLDLKIVMKVNRVTIGGRRIIKKKKWKGGV